MSKSQSTSNQSLWIEQKKIHNLNNTISVNCTTDRNNHVSEHGPVKEVYCSIIVLLQYSNHYEIYNGITYRHKVPKKNVIENQKSTDHDKTMIERDMGKHNLPIQKTEKDQHEIWTKTGYELIYRRGRQFLLH